MLFFNTTLMQKGNTYRNIPDSYELRLLAFIDILGWADLLKKSETNKELFSLLLDASNKLSNVAINQKEFLSGFSDEAKKIVHFESYPIISHFSDTIVMSCIPDYSAATILIHHVQNICRTFLQKEYLTRGAIVLGNIHHSEQDIFGPALVDAYLLEKNIAFYPRIIIDRKALPLIHQSTKVGEETTYPRNVRKDFDDMLYLDILGGVPTGWQNEKRHSFWNEQKLLEDAKTRMELHRNDTKKLQKHAWLVGYLEQIVNECSK